MKLSQSRIAANLRDADRTDVSGDPDPMPPLPPRPAAASLPGGWLLRQVALNGERIEHCQATERAIRGRIVLRARLAWDGDRRLEATILGGKLASDPERVVARLRESPHGVDWLLSRWTLLVRAGEAQGGWTGDQAQLANDLLGTPDAFRHADGPGAWVAFDAGSGGAPGKSPLDLARFEIADLQVLRTTLVALDDQARARAEDDLAADSDPEIKRLRRHEATLHNRLRWALERIEGLAIDAEARPDAAPGATSGPDVAPGEEAEAPDPSPTRASSRVEARPKQAEDRRKALERKRGRQRA